MNKTINSRIKQVRKDFCNNSNIEFAKRMQKQPNTTSNWVRDGYNVGRGVASEISSKFPVNIAWLLTGDGEMLKAPAHGKDMDGYRMVPVYNFDVVGGMDAWNDVVGCPEYIEKYVPFSGASENDLCVHVTGNSMMPTYSSGSLLLIRRVEGWREYFGYGHCYVILLKDGRRILKEVQKSEVNPKENVLCVSYNPKIPPEELSREFIADVYKVIMTLTNEGY